MRLTEDKIRCLYNKYKQEAISYVCKKQYSTSLKYVESAAFTAYNFYLDFKDDDLEFVVSKIAKSLYSIPWKKKQSKTFIFYDTFSIDNCGLTQQYLSAIVGMGVDLVYITEKDNFLSSESEIKKNIQNYSKTTIIEIPSIKDLYLKAQYIYEVICKVGADSIFIHTGPKASSAVTAFLALPKEIKKYKVNLTDHTFWLGANIVDYSLEFRPYGCYVSNKYRGIDIKKIFLIPFYPIMREAKFEGFPSAVKNKTIIFSGGAFYKIYDENDTYFKLVSIILNRFPNVVILYAGQGNTNSLNEKIQKYKLQNKFLLIGQRRDITEVFRRCDIYLNTYPCGGGLMCQYAAQMGKPIVSLCSGETSKVEEFVCQIAHTEITDISIEDLINKVEKLICDISFRKEYSESIANCTVNENKFNSIFKHVISTNDNLLSIDISNIHIHSDALNIRDKIKYENAEKCFHRIIVKIFGISSIWRCPQFLIDSLLLVIRENRLRKVLQNR